MIKKNFQKKEAGFTLVEVITASFVFSILAIGMGLIFTQTLNLERRAFAAQKIQENGLYVLELMAREIRVSTITNQDSNCGLSSLTISHPVNGTVTYSLNNNILYRMAVDPGTSQTVQTELSSNEVLINSLNFCVQGSGVGDGQQTRVTILVSIQNKTGRDILTANLQTTLALRDFRSE